MWYLMWYCSYLRYVVPSKACGLLAVGSHISPSKPFTLSSTILAPPWCRVLVQSFVAGKTCASQIVPRYTWLSALAKIRGVFCQKIYQHTRSGWSIWKARLATLTSMPRQGDGYIVYQVSDTWAQPWNLQELSNVHAKVEELSGPQHSIWEPKPRDRRFPSISSHQ